jgi:hypothetical protein
MSEEGEMKLRKRARAILKDSAKIQSGRKDFESVDEGPARELELFGLVRIFEPMQRGLQTSWETPKTGPIRVQITERGLQEAKPGWRKAWGKLFAQWPSIVGTTFVGVLGLLATKIIPW